MAPNSEDSKPKRRRKRSVPELVEVFYDFIKQYDEIHLSDFRKIEDPDRRISSPTDRNLLDIITAIQDREYIYVKKVGRYTLLKASSKPRDQKHRFVQLYDQIKFVRDEKEKMNLRVKNAAENEHSDIENKLVISQYQKLIDDIINKLELVNTTERIPESEGYIQNKHE